MTNLPKVDGGRGSFANRLGEMISFLYVQRIRGFATPSEPSLDGPTSNRLRSELEKAGAYLEFGSGGSTILADRLNVPTVTIESDPYYARAVRKGLKNFSVEILTPDIGLTGPWGWPLFKRPTPKRLARWQQYARMPFERYDRSFPDVVLVDGRFRVACALETAWQAHRRGVRSTLIIDDYSMRPHYRTVEQAIGCPEMVGRAAVFAVGLRAVPRPRAIDPA